MSKLIAPSKLPDYGIDLSNRERHRLEKLGRFPKRVYVTAKSHAYVLDEILAHQEEAIALRDAGKRPSGSVTGFAANMARGAAA